MSNELTDPTPTVGLNTQLLNNGEVSSKQVESEDTEPSNTIFDVTQEIDAKTKELLQAIEQNDKLVEKSFNEVSVRLQQVRSKLSSADT